MIPAFYQTLDIRFLVSVVTRPINIFEIILLVFPFIPGYLSSNMKTASVCSQLISWHGSFIMRQSTTSDSRYK